MIISASYKTDLPAFYGAWFANRLAAGYCRVVNPYGGPPFTVPLTPETVDGFVFWTRNTEPFLDGLAMVRNLKFPFVIQYTITGYPRALESSVLDAERSVAQVHALAATYGPRAVVWRYDPVIFTSLTPARWHLERFAALAKALAGAVDEVVLSFAHVYRKTARNLEAAARAHAFTWRDAEPEEKQTLLAEFASIARDHGLTLGLCGQDSLRIPGVEEARCIDARRLGDIAGRTIPARPRPHRSCGCVQSRDIGAYETCPHGCVYCYAVSRRAEARRRHQLHDPLGAFLFPPAMPPPSD
ncbi:MAG: DUF1848 domain-containing protein [Alphaproteobacteria bacterium]